MDIVDGLRNFFQSLTVVGWGIFVTSLVIFLVTSAIFLLRRGGDRYAWFLVGLVAIFLGVGLRYGIPYATELLSYGIGDSLIWVPNIQKSVGDAFDMAVSPWLDDAPDPVVTITESEVTILATGGIPGPTATPEPSATPTLGSGVGGPVDPLDTPIPLTDDEIAATAIVLQQTEATFTPRPPTAVPTLDMSIWNPQTPAPTPLNSGGN